MFIRSFFHSFIHFNHREILEILEKMRAMLAEQAKRAKPLEPDVEGGAGKNDGRSKGCLGTCTIPCVPVDGQMNNSPMDTRGIYRQLKFLRNLFDRRSKTNKFSLSSS